MANLFYQLAILRALDGLPQFLKDTRPVVRATGRMRWRTLATMAELSRRYSESMQKEMPERAIFDTSILPYYQLSNDFESIVIVGCEWQTPRYASLLAHKKIMTIDPDPARAHQGAANHSVCHMRSMTRLLPKGSADLIICNGIVGTILDSRDTAEVSLEAACDTLCPGGHLLLGYRDDPAALAFDPADIKALAAFEPCSFEPLGAAVYRAGADPAYVYRFYRKPEADA